MNMVVKDFVNKITTYLVIIFFLLGAWDAMAVSKTEIPVYQTAMDSANTGNYDYLFNLAKMSWGWSQITPAIHSSTLPDYLTWYGWYFKLFLPSQFIPLPGWEGFIFLAIILIVLFPIAISLKKSRIKRGSAFSIPLWFWLLIPILILLLYPIWSWIHLHWFFIPGAQEILNISSDSAYNVWLGFSEKSESFSWFFVIMTFLGVYKGGEWGLKFKRW